MIIYTKGDFVNVQKNSQYERIPEFLVNSWSASWSFMAYWIFLDLRYGPTKFGLGFIVTSFRHFRRNGRCIICSVLPIFDIFTLSSPSAYFCGWWKIVHRTGNQKCVLKFQKWALGKWNSCQVFALRRIQICMGMWRIFLI